MSHRYKLSNFSPSTSPTKNRLARPERNRNISVVHEPARGLFYSWEPHVHFDHAQATGHRLLSRGPGGQSLLRHTLRLRPETKVRDAKETLRAAFVPTIAKYSWLENAGQDLTSWIFRGSRRNQRRAESVGGGVLVKDGSWGWAGKSECLSFR